MKIGFIQQDSRIGGAENNLLNLMMRLDRSRFQPLVLLPEEGPLADRLRQLGVDLRIVARRRLFSTSTYISGAKVFNPLAAMADACIALASVPKITALLSEEKVTLVQTSSTIAHLYGGLAARLAKVPCVWHLQDLIDPRLTFGLSRSVFLRSATYLPKVIVVVSKSIGEMFAGSGANADKIRLIHNAIDISRFNPAIDGRQARRRLGIRGDELVVGIVGRLTPWKGHREFLRAAARISTELDNVRFLIVGDTTFGHDEYKLELVEMADRLGLSHKAMFLGARSDVPSLLRAMDVFLHTSVKPEPFGLVVIEAMASGVPVIASKFGGPAEIIQHGEDGYLVEPSDTEAVTGYLRALLLDESLRRRVGAAGRGKVSTDFSIERFVSQMQEVYEQFVPCRKANQQFGAANTLGIGR